MNRLVGAFCMGLLFLGTLSSYAQTTVTVKKDGSGDYTKISDALASSALEIVVYPGSYQENLTISRTVRIRAYEGPNITTIDGSGNVSKSVIIISASITNVEISGLRLCNGYAGVYFNSNASGIVSNCIIENNNNQGIYVPGGSSGTNVYIQNNVIANNGTSGIYIDLISTYQPYVTIISNIILQNRNCGLYADSTSYNTERISVSYNLLYLNTPSNYNSSFGGSGIVLGAGMMYDSDPKFIGTGTTDVRLQASSPISPCIDAGPVTASKNDPDGSRNDMGAFGGPNAMTFFDSPLDGPIVRQVTVNPSPVIQGGTFTVHATAAVR